VLDVIKLAITRMALVAGALIGTWRMQLHPGTELVFTDGVFFGIARLRSGSLLLPVAFHVLGNSIAIAQRLY
jgi:membrane protease YdiL (CAAX protease family)